MGAKTKSPFRRVVLPAVVIFLFFMSTKWLCARNSAEQRHAVYQATREPFRPNTSVETTKPKDLRRNVDVFRRNKQRGDALGYNLGICDVDILAGPMGVVYSKIRAEKRLRGKHILFIDIGANIGRTSQIIMTRMTDAQCATIWQPGHAFACPESELLISFEPVAANFDVLKGNGHTLMWNNSWLGVKAAVSDQDTNVTFYTSGQKGDEQGSLHPDSAFSTSGTHVRAVSLDNFFKHGPRWAGQDSNLLVPEFVGNVTRMEEVVKTQDYEIMLLKIDTEGFDYFVTRGARDILLTKQPKVSLLWRCVKVHTYKYVVLRHSLLFLSTMASGRVADEPQDSRMFKKTSLHLNIVAD